jgi:hypothetical protein
MRFFWAIILCSLGFSVFSQIRIEIVQVPPLLVKEGKLYIAGTFNNWNPGDPQYTMQRSSNGRYWIDLPEGLDSFEYKFTQGNWVLTEGSGVGGTIGNRRYNKVTEKNPKYVEAVIEGWEKKPGYNFVVKVIPSGKFSTTSTFCIPCFLFDIHLSAQLDINVSIILLFRNDPKPPEIILLSFSKQRNDCERRLFLFQITFSAPSQNKPIALMNL